jgi:hypothetical protein
MNFGLQSTWDSYATLLARKNEYTYVAKNVGRLNPQIHHPYSKTTIPFYTFFSFSVILHYLFL